MSHARWRQHLGRHPDIATAKPFPLAIAHDARLFVKISLTCPCGAIYTEQGRLAGVTGAIDACRDNVESLLLFHIQMQIFEHLFFIVLFIWASELCGVLTTRFLYRTDAGLWRGGWMRSSRSETE